MPLQPTRTRLVRRRMKSPVASSSICSLSNAFGLKFQSKPSRVLLSAKRASRMRRATARSRRALASAPSSRSRKLRCEKLSFSALARSSSRAAASTGIPSTAKWLRQRSRNGLFSFVVFVFVVFIVLCGWLQQTLVLGRGARGQRRLAQNLVELFLRFDRQRFHCGAWPGLRRQYPLHGRIRKGTIARRAFQGAGQVLAVVNRKESQNARRLVFPIASGAQ